jgi:hypothetical protein
MSTVINDIVVAYDKDLSAEGIYKQKLHVTDSDSIQKYTVHEALESYDLIHSEAIAQMVADRLIRLLSTPVVVFSSYIFMPVGYKLEKGDRVKISSFITPNIIYEGNVLTCARTFASGKNGALNRYYIEIADPIAQLSLVLHDGVVVDDYVSTKNITVTLEDGITVDDSSIEREFAETIVDAAGIDDSDLTFHFQIHKVLIGASDDD